MEKKIKYSSYQAYAALGVGFVCLVIGLPLWWNTTSIYRVQLPYSQIESLSQSVVHVTVHVEVISLDEAATSSDLALITKIIQAGADKGGNEAIITRYHVTSRHCLPDELEAYKQSTTFSELDDKMARASRSGDRTNKYHIICVPMTTHLKGGYPHVGSLRNAYVTFTDVKAVATEALWLTREVLVQESSLRKKYDSVNVIKPQKPDKETMRSVKSSLGYDVTFSLVVDEPHILDVRWNIRQFVNDYIQPFVNELPIDINIKSQVLTYPGLFLRAEKSHNASFYRHSDLPHMINPMESKLGSYMSNNPGLEFIVYVPRRDQSPLYIRNLNGEPVPTNSFLSPQWGGILIYNIPDPPSGASLPYKVEVRGEKVMPVFLTQLRLLIGAQSQIFHNVSLASLPNTGIHKWELDSFMRSRCVENIVTATLTLQSLARLLGQIGNIVINDDIGNEVHSAVKNIQDSYNSLKHGSLEEAFTFSQSAIKASEKAFFDPSLLELLYFPEDQKFAIYIPLFLPMGLPVVTSVIHAIRWIKSRRTQHAKTD